MFSRSGYRGVFFIAIICVLSCTSASQTEERLEGYAALCARGVAFEDASDLDSLIALCSGSRLVLLGESTHGTSEYYRWRAEISKRLVVEQGFRFIAVEADWMPMYRLNLYVKWLLDEEGVTAASILRGFSRWPEWMWGNTEVEALAEWLREHNRLLPVDERVGIYGMDVYGQWEAMDEVLAVVSALIPDEEAKVREHYGCFTRFGRDEWRYAQAVTQGLASCDHRLHEVVHLLKSRWEAAESEEEERLLFHGMQSAKVVLNAEDFYRLSAQGDNNGSWNSRATHMHHTTGRLLKRYGEEARGIVWAHNTHIGDARATSMAVEGRVNIGQLSRELYGESSITGIGFTTYTGRVNAGSRWGAPMSIMDIPRAAEGSLEYLLNKCGLQQFFVVFDQELENDEVLNNQIGHRAIGVVYNPATERRFNYVPTVLTQRYDALVFFHATKELEPVK